jgi:hypothetical protein
MRRERATHPDDESDDMTATEPVDELEQQSRVYGYDLKRIATTLANYPMRANLVRLERALARDGGHTDTPDGHRRNTGANDGRGGGNRIPVETGEVDADGNKIKELVEFTPTELAVIARQRLGIDTHHRQVRRALAALNRAANALDQLTGALAAIENEAKPDPNAQPTKREIGCASCARIGDYSPRWPLDNPTALCQWCYRYKTDQPTWNPDREWPPIALVRMHKEGRKIFDRDIAEVVRKAHQSDASPT